MTARRLLLLGLALLLSLRLPGTTVVPPDIDSLIKESDYVVRAVVTSATPEWRVADGKPYISTHLELKVNEVIKGSPPSPLTLDVPGGRVGEVEMTVTGMPVFNVGDENILFVRGEDKKMFPLVAMMHGIYPILHDSKSGQDYVLRCNGMPLYSSADVSLPMEQLSSVPKQSPDALPLTAKAFIREIRQRAVTPQRRANEN